MHEPIGLWRIAQHQYWSIVFVDLRVSWACYKARPKLCRLQKKVLTFCCVPNLRGFDDLTDVDEANEPQKLTRLSQRFAKCETLHDSLAFSAAFSRRCSAQITIVIVTKLHLL